MITTHTPLTVSGTLDITPSPKKWALRLLAWLVAKDQAYRDHHHFQSLSAEALKDVGLHR